LNIGVAAHITAASPSGPRYNPDLTSDQRAGLANGIWLCQNCAKLIDSDQARFTVKKLQSWKREAEKYAKTHVGKTLPSSKSSGSAYKREIRKMSTRFSMTLSKLDIYRPVGLMTHFDLATANFLRYASVLNYRVAVAMIKDKSLAINEGEKAILTCVCFMALVRGFLLDRFVQKGNLSPDVFPELPKWKTLTQRWYKNVLLENKWLVEWSDELSRDLVDMQWLEIAGHFDEQPADPKSPAIHEVLKISILHGMIARRFLSLGACDSRTVP